jgi:hypothetical protein
MSKASCFKDDDCLSQYAYCSQGMCKCPTGFIQQKSGCVNVNECSAGYPNGCNSNSNCIDAIGSYKYNSKDGFEDLSLTNLSGCHCKQINKCAKGLHSFDLATQICIDKHPPEKCHQLPHIILKHLPQHVQMEEVSMVMGVEARVVTYQQLPRFLCHLSNFQLPCLNPLAQIEEVSMVLGTVTMVMGVEAIVVTYQQLPQFLCHLSNFLLPHLSPLVQVEEMPTKTEIAIKETNFKCKLTITFREK